MKRQPLNTGIEAGFRTDPRIKGRLCLKQAESRLIVNSVRTEVSKIKHSADHDDSWIEFIDNRAKAHGLFKEKEPNRLEIYDPPLDSDVPPSRGEEEMELNFIQAQREEEEHQRMAELFGPKPGRFETEWN